MTKYKTMARYAPCGLGYNVWRPGAEIPEFWFGSIKEVFEFTKACGWKKIRAI